MNRFSLYKRWHDIKSEASTYNISPFALIVSLIKFRLVTGLGPRYYLIAGFANPVITENEKYQHISHKAYHHALDILNPSPYRKTTHHKLIEIAFLSLSCIPSSNFIGFLHQKKGFLNHTTPLCNERDLNQCLAGYVSEYICFKPVEGHGGKGVSIYKVCQKSNTSHFELESISDKNTISTTKLLSQYQSDINKQGLLIESYVNQHATYQQYNPSSINTIRVWVLDDGNNINVIGAYLRVGRKGAIVDNGDAGGIIFPICMTTTEILPGFTTSTIARENFINHPDSNQVIAGQALPMWDDIVTFSQHVLRCLPNSRFAGLDIAITDDGPLVIEINVCPDKDGAAYANIPSKLLQNAAEN
ncbi:sugar-transfer associated ATP-grasp domain-containing protein [Colwelliaceae bacterium 6471]